MEEGHVVENINYAVLRLIRKVISRPTFILRAWLEQNVSLCLNCIHEEHNSACTCDAHAIMAVFYVNTLTRMCNMHVTMTVFYINTLTRICV